MSGSQSTEAIKIAEDYYDSDPADRFYFNIWGGEDIHVGIYDETLDVRTASHRTVQRMAAQLDGLGAESRIIDLGAGYGGAARYLARQYGCHVTCLNLSETQNARNRAMSLEAGLGDKVNVIHGAFEKVPEADGAFDIAWSQDAFLHSSDREKVLREARRVLSPGGQLIFTDPMQADDCPEGVLDSILERIHLSSLASFEFYREAAGRSGFEVETVTDLTPQLGRHYARVHAELSGRYEESVKLSGKEYVDRMLKGLTHWVMGERKGYLSWGIIRMRAV